VLWEGESKFVSVVCPSWEPWYVAFFQSCRPLLFARNATLLTLLVPIDNIMDIRNPKDIRPTNLA
jgi:hypothetical protein